MRPAGRIAKRVDERVVLVAGLALGLGVRLVLVRYRGTADTFTYEDWATATRRVGLAHAYGGIYFPLEYQALAAASWAATTFHLSFVTSLKAFQLIADGGIAAMLSIMLPRLGATRNWILVYWLHPYTLAMFWLSYVDFQVGFLVLLAVALLLIRRDWLAFLVAGIPLGAAFLMKPQVILVVALFIALAALVIAARAVGRARPPSAAAIALTLVGPLLFFTAYSAYFYKHGYSRTYLVDSYRSVSNTAPSLTANMPNIWYPVAFAEQKPGEASYTVTGPHVLHTVGAAITLGLLAVVAIAVARGWQTRPRVVSVLLLLAFGTLIAPMTETRAHENHLYLGWLLALPVMAIVRRRRFTTAVLLLGFLDFANLLLIYAFGLNGISRTQPLPWLAGHYSPDARLALAVLAICVFAILLAEIWAILAPDVRFRRAFTVPARS